MFLAKIKANLWKTLCPVLLGDCEQFQLVEDLVSWAEFHGRTAAFCELGSVWAGRWAQNQASVPCTLILFVVDQGMQGLSIRLRLLKMVV